MSKFTSKLVGQRVLILGGTSGIGYAVAEGALEHGATVIISSSQQTRVDSKVAELKNAYPDAHERILGKTCDMTNLDQQEANILALLEFATDGKTKKLDHLVITAGGGFTNPGFAEYTHNALTEALTSRLYGVMMILKRVGTYVNKSVSSSITLTSGASVYKPRPGWILPIVVGGALDGLLRAAAVTLAPIRVNLAAPGLVATERLTGGEKPETAEQIDALVEKMNVKGVTLTGAIGLPEDTAEVYLYFMRDKSVTGTVLGNDGGYLLK